MGSATAEAEAEGAPANAPRREWGAGRLTTTGRPAGNGCNAKFATHAPRRRFDPSSVSGVSRRHQRLARTHVSAPARGRGARRVRRCRGYCCIRRGRSRAAPTRAANCATCGQIRGSRWWGPLPNRATFGSRTAPAAYCRRLCGANVDCDGECCGMRQGRVAATSGAYVSPLRQSANSIWTGPGMMPLETPRPINSCTAARPRSP